MRLAGLNLSFSWGRSSYTLKNAFALYAGIRQELELSGLRSSLIYRGLDADRFRSIVKDGSLMRRFLPVIIRIKGQVTSTQMKTLRLESPGFLRILHNQVAEMLHNLFATIDQFHGAFADPCDERTSEHVNSGKCYLEIFRRVRVDLWFLSNSRRYCQSPLGYSSVFKCLF